MTKSLVLPLVAVLALSASPVRAEEVVAQQPRERGFLTGLGLGFLVTSLVGVGVGVSGSAISGNADALFKAYTGSIPPSEEPTITALRQRASTGSAMAVVGFVGAGLFFAAGLTCLLLDKPNTAAPRIAFTPALGGGVFVFNTTF